MKIERVFSTESHITIQDIIHSLINIKIDSVINKYYHQNKVNTAASSKKENVA